jgi:hypothetical protein
MNQTLYEEALAILDSMTMQDHYDMLQEFGIDFVLRQYPEPEEKEEE